MAAATSSNATTAAAAKPKKQKRTDVTVANGATKKPRVATPVKKTQSNTLDSWFKRPAATSAAASKPADAAAASTTKSSTASHDEEDASSAASSESPVAEPAAEHTPAAHAVEKKSALRTTNSSSSAKKLVQRRIHINDPCRVCEAARTEDTSRCELRCLGCDMTVHKKCYGVESEDPIDEWHCRRCQFVLDKRAALRSDANVDDKASGDDSDKTTADSSAVLSEPITERDFALLPVHAPLAATHRYHALHTTSDFATVFQFLKRFRRMGLKISTDMTIATLADALVQSPPPKFLDELHVRLLTNIEATISKNQDWTVSLARFLASANPMQCTAAIDAFIATGTTAATSAAQSKNESTKTPPATSAELYAALSARERVALLKFVCEAQFDDNDALVERIGDQDGDALRDEPAGTDALGRTYWVIEDAPSVLDGTVWVCRCTAAKTAQANGDAATGAAWETVSDNLESLESLVESFALSAETADLQLWQRFESGILKSLVRRSKKQQANAARLARMPRMLGTNVAGLDLGSYVDDDGFGVRRSTRSRRAVTYRVESDDEDDDDEDGGGSNDDEDDEPAADDDNDNDDDDDDESSGNEREGSRVSTQQQQRGRAKPSARTRTAAAEPSRRSSRLRNDASPPLSPLRSSRRASRSSPDRRGASSPRSSPSPPRRRSDRRVAAATRSSSAGRRRRRGEQSSSSSSSSESASESDEQVEKEEDEAQASAANNSDNA